MLFPFSRPPLKGGGGKERNKGGGQVNPKTVGTDLSKKFALRKNARILACVKGGEERCQKQKRHPRKQTQRRRNLKSCCTRRPRFTCSDRSPAPSTGVMMSWAPP